MRTAAIAALCCALAGCTIPGGTAASSARTASVARTQAPVTPSAGRIEPTITPAATVVTPTASLLPPFVCSDASGGVSTTANVTAVRVSEGNGYDRFVIQFDSDAVPLYRTSRQTTSTFASDASGQPATLDGTNGLLVHLASTTEHNTYTGSTDFRQPGYAVLKEARLLGDFEGNVSWGLGLSRAACMRVLTLSEPSRLVIDFTTA